MEEVYNIYMQAVITPEHAVVTGFEVAVTSKIWQ